MFTILLTIFAFNGHNFPNRWELMMLCYKWTRTMQISHRTTIEIQISHNTVKPIGKLSTLSPPNLWNCKTLVGKPNS